MSRIADLAREAFHWLEVSGFRYAGEEDRLPSFAVSTFKRGGIAVRVHWDGRDHASWTTLTRGHRLRRPLPGRELGLGHLSGGGPPSVGLPDPAVDPEPLKAALGWDSRLLREQGAALLAGHHDAWMALAGLQDEHMGADSL